MYQNDRKNMTVLTFGSSLATVASEPQSEIIRNPNPKRERLKELSKIAADLVRDGKYESINQALVEHFYKGHEHKEFKTFNQWKQDGFFVKAGSEAFVVWGRPKAKPEETEEADENKFFPMAYLFSNAQVIPTTAKAQESEGIYGGIYNIDWRLKRVSDGVIVKSASEVEDYIRPMFEDVMETREKFIVLYLTRSNEILGSYVAGLGGITSTVVDIQLILRHALLYGASSMILSHNHPSGALKPSDADITLTKKIAESAKVMDLKVIDHVIISYKGIYSFTDEGLL